MFIKMTEANTTVKLNTEEGRNKAESLFSTKFREYLSSKKTSGFGFTQKFFPKEYSGSSSETASESSKKSFKKSKKKLKEKKPYWNVQYTLRNRLVQCSLLEGEAELVPPDDLKTFLTNVSTFLQDIKQLPPDFEYLYNVIGKITLLLSQFVRRPVQKIPENEKGDHMKNAEKTVKAMVTLVDEYKNELNLDPDNGVREFKRIQKEIAVKEHELNEVRKILSANTEDFDLRVKDKDLLVRNSFLANEYLKFDIKFNQGRLKKYKKALVEKEWTKHKLESDLAHMRKKKSKVDLSDNDSLDKLSGCSETNTKKESFPKAQCPKSTKTKKGKRHTK